MSLHIVFVEPEIPPNTGNIARTCAATNTVLHLVKPLGFNIDDKSLKRAGLDYWPYVKLEVHESLDDFMEKYIEKDKYISKRRIKKLVNKSQKIKEESSVFQRKNSVDYDSVMQRQKTIMYKIERLIDGALKEKTKIFRL